MTDIDRLFIETIPQMVWMTDAGGVTLFLNRRGAENLGVDPKAVYGWDWLEYVHPDDVDHARRAWLEAVQERSAYVSEYRVRHPDGTYRWYLAQAAPYIGPNGEVGRWIGTWTDIDRRKRTEEKLRASEERFRQIAESIDEVFWLTSPGKDEIAYLNPAFESIWGTPREAVYANPLRWLEAVHPEDRGRVEAALARQRTGAYDEEYRIVRPDGSIRWIRDRAFPVRDDRGNLIRLAGVAEDVTERRDLEAQLRQAQKMEAVGHLAGGVAHDFNNLLTVIMGNSELLLEALGDDEALGKLAYEIREAGKRSAALTRQLLSFTRKQVLSPKVIDVNDVVRGLEKMLRRVIGEKIELRVTLAPGIGRVKADPAQLEQVLLNLAVNALDAMPRGGSLEIATREVPGAARAGGSRREPGRSVLLSVSDTGTGMTEEVQRHVFEPFFTTKEVGRGTGLGLAVVHGIVQESGGRVEVESTEGQGTTFRIHLPRVEPDAEAEEARSADAPPAMPPGGSETILLVEDDGGVRVLGGRILRRYGYEVLEASHGDEAIRVFERHPGPIDLLVTDVVMPGTGGRRVAERLRAEHPRLKVLYVSGYPDDELVRHGVLAEEIELLQKPFSPEALARKVREVLG